MTDRLREQLENVSVPAEGRERVLARLAEEWGTISGEPAGTEPPVIATAGGGIGPRGRWSRRGLLASAVCAAGLAVGGGWWISTPRLNPREIEQAVVAATASEESSSPLASGEQIPYTWEWPRTFDASVLHTARRSLVSVQGQGIVVLSFQLRRSRGGSVPGWFVVVPAKWLKGMPTAPGFLGGEFSYSNRHTATWWVEGSYAYACGLGTGDTRLFERCLPQRWAT